MTLRGVNYWWDTENYPNKKFNTQKQIGVIAQEIEAVYPELVHTDETGYKSVNYDQFGPILIEAIKEQQQLIENLQIENTVLKNLNSEQFNQLKVEKDREVNELKNEIKEIKQLLNQTTRK